MTAAASLLMNLVVVGGLAALGGRFTQSSSRPSASSCRRTSLLTARAVAPVPPRALPDGAVVELWHNGRLHLGNSRGVELSERGSTTLRVELSTGEVVKVDGGQLVDAWTVEPHGGASVPGTAAEWSAAHADAAKLLNELPPHALDLQPLWQTLTTQRGGCGCVSSDRVSAALFAEEPERQPQRQGQGVGGGGGGGVGGGGGGGGGGGAAHDGGGWVARRMAGAQLLGEERVLFKPLKIIMSRTAGAVRALIHTTGHSCSRRYVY